MSAAPTSTVDSATLNAHTAAPRKPELLAPAGDWDCVRAAVENGADAVYFGLQRFNARIRANNFTEADLPRLMEFLHRRSVRGYVTFNILVFPNELADAVQYLRTLFAAGVDAAIVQDVGLARLIRRLSPDFPIHASTQMTVTSEAGVEFARELGAETVVLARECAVKEIARIHAGPVTLQTFVHGALCVAYSGQYLTSEALGGRSANRGECAQACRMPYELICDGQPVPLGDRRYLLSPQDLAGLEILPDLIRAGVGSLKIEGRLKAPEYVANITRVYRQGIDRVFAELIRGGGRPDEAAQQLRRESSYDLEMAFSRGLFTGWMRGINNQELVHGRFGTKRGVFLGEVTRVQGAEVLIRLEGPVKLGDGVVFDAGRPDLEEQGGRVYSVTRRGADAALSFGRDDLDLREVHPGDKLWKTSDPQWERRVRQSYGGDAPKFQRPLHLEIHGRAGELIIVTARDDDGHVARVASTLPLAVAEKHPLTEARLREQLGRLGGTPFCLGKLASHLEGAVILPVSELNRLRREAVIELETQRARPRRWQLNETISDEALLAIESAAGTRPSSSTTDAELIVLVRNIAQLETTLRCGVRIIYAEFEDPKKYRAAVQTVRLAQGCGEAGAVRPEIWVAPPRIAKPGEEWILPQVRSCDADGYLVRNYEHLRFFANDRRRGDYSLNVANGLSAEYFLRRFGLERVTASYDLNVEQLESLLRSAPPEWFEITLHQHMPMFHMEHCVFCAFLSKGTDYTNCGRPCDTHVVQLRDRVGAMHPVKADAGCRNTVFNARAQTGAESVGRLLALGARVFRLEFMDETPEEVARTIARYRQLLRGEITGTQLWRELRLWNQLGVTRGQMDKSER